MALNGTALLADYLTPTVTQTSILGIGWLIGLVVIFLTLLTITRDYSKWSRLAFPIAVMWQIVGLNVGIVVIVVSAFIWVIDALSIKQLEKMVMTLGKSRREEKAILQQERKTLLRKSVRKGISGKKKNKKGLLVNTMTPTEEVVFKEALNRQKTLMQRLKERKKK